MNTVDILKAARALIVDPKCWTKGAIARDGSGEATRSRSKGATCWCALGAIDRATPLETSRRTQRDAGDALRRAAHGGIVRFNDDPGTTHANILTLFDRAIAAEEEITR